MSAVLEIVGGLAVAIILLLGVRWAFENVTIKRKKSK